MSTGLKKRSFTDTVIICIFCGAALVISLWQLICFIGDIVPSYQQISTGETSAAVSVTFDSKNLLIIVVGVVIGILSEVFVCGYELQQDNDSIA